MKLEKGEEGVFCTAAKMPKNVRSDVRIVEQGKKFLRNGQRKKSERFWEE